MPSASVAVARSPARVANSCGDGATAAGGGAIRRPRTSNTATTGAVVAATTTDRRRRLSARTCSSDSRPHCKAAVRSASVSAASVTAAPPPPPLLPPPLLLPAVIGGLWAMSWQGAASAFFWGSLVRVGLLHHVTWSINSICHTIGERPFFTRDKSGNVWWLAILSFGESWHNLHHADPTCARHGVLRGQLDSSARLIWTLERLGWVRDVRWPVRERIEQRLAGAARSAGARAA